ncbi:unnamed protein product [Phytophthora lilii]|uniref:Unnamed protein product n=1 Tax=Phytophthora lilii TaxID=2077276 RepID=A0A9W6TBG4_9STRA|nr:unnamed protein product [Phytophthora lilii]
MLFGNEWALSTTLMQEHDDVFHPVRFIDRVVKPSELNYHPAEKEVLALLQLLKQCYVQLSGRTIYVYTQFSTLEWVHKSKALFGRAMQFAALLSPWHLVVTRVNKSDVAFSQLLQSTITSFVDADRALLSLHRPTEASRSLCCAWILWQLPEWTIVTAASAYLESTTVNQAEYEGMNNGVSAALEHGAENLVIVGDSRLAIQQSLGVVACRKESLLTQLNHHRALAAKFKSVRYLHVVCEYNAAADALASETLENKAPVNPSTSRQTELAELNRIPEVIYEPSVDLQLRLHRRPNSESSDRDLTQGELEIWADRPN